MREIVVIQMGDCGNKVGKRFWELISEEHTINNNGLFTGDNILPYQRLNVYYECAPNIRFVPRCAVVDLDPTQPQILKCSEIGSIFNPDHFVTGSQGTGNNFAKGFYTEGAELMERVLEVVRKQTENCDLLQGFQILHSVGGGTGSGMGSLLINNLRCEYFDRIINTFTIFPSDKISETVVEPYNAIMALSEMIPHTDETINFDNEALYDICLNSLKVKKPRVGDLNHLISMTMAGVTTCFRYPGQLNTDLRKLLTNMCPFPRLHFFIPGYAPLFSIESTIQYEHITVKSLTRQLFSPGFQMAGINENDYGKYLTCAAIFRGPLPSKDVEEAMMNVQETNPEIFAKWIPNNIKSAICDIPPSGVSASSTLLANTSSICCVFNRILKKFDTMFEKKAFVHWFTGEGMDELEFSIARDNVVDVKEEYMDAGNGFGQDENEDESDDDDYSSLNYDTCPICTDCMEARCVCECEKVIELE